MNSDRRFLALMLLMTLPALALLGFFLWHSERSMFSQFVVAVSVLSWLLVVGYQLRRSAQYSLRTLSTLVEAVRLQDYSLRSARADEPGALGELCGQLNTLAEQLQGSQRQEQELRSLLVKIIAQIDVAIVACDSEQRIRLVNPLAAKLLACDADSLIGCELASTALAELDFADKPRVVEHRFPAAAGRWQLVQQNYREQGRPGKLLFISDLQQVLRAEETAAWQRLIRVIAHEVNNSLTPIVSISDSVRRQLLKSQAELGGRGEELAAGVELIAARAGDLRTFIGSYARLARLPAPVCRDFSLAELLQKLSTLFSAHPYCAIEIPYPDIQLCVDPLLIEQLLINLLKNAVEATAEGGAVSLHCVAGDSNCEIRILDEGLGIANPENLFVPFYSSKRQGSGIGLVLSRQIAEAHGGQLSLCDRQDRQGAVATLLLPL